MAAQPSSPLSKAADSTAVSYFAGGDPPNLSSSSSGASLLPHDSVTRTETPFKISKAENRVNAEREDEELKGNNDWTFDENLVISGADGGSTCSSCVGNNGVELSCSSSTCSSEKLVSCDEVAESENCTLQDALKEMSEVNVMYEEKMRWIEENIRCCPTRCINAIGRANVWTSWVADLREQNQTLIEIILDQAKNHKTFALNSSLCTRKLEEKIQEQSLLIHSMQDDIKKYRQTCRKFQHDKDVALKSVLAWEASSRTLCKRLAQSESQVTKLVCLLTRIRDGCKWDLTDLEFSPPIHNELFGNHPNLPGSTVISETALESASQASFLLNEKCAELEAAREELESLRSKCETTEKLLEEQVKSSTELAANFSRADLLLKDYHNQIEEMKGKIRVYCRIRPFSSPADKSRVSIVSTADDLTIVVQSIRGGPKEFTFDRVFGPDSSQEQVFAEMKSLILSAMHGYNICIAAYGQTGSGKTFTIIGDTRQPGIAPRTSAHIFHLISERESSHESTVSFYAIELYNQKLIDLLSDPSNTAAEASENDSSACRPEIRRDSDGIVNIQGCRLIRVESSGRLMEKMMQAVASRHCAATCMNDRSSRSHLILGILIQSTCKLTGCVTRGKISLLDLAGSERQGKVMSSGMSFQESKLINKSLSALEHVIVALTTDQPHVPYRNNKLTEIMQDSIGGNAKTLFIINISPSKSNVDETLVSLNYGTRIKQVVNNPSKQTTRPNKEQQQQRIFKCYT